MYYNLIHNTFIINNMKISPFHALTILAKHTRNAEVGSREHRVFEQIKRLFLMGVENDIDFQILKNLLKDKALKGYEVALVEPSEFILLRKKTSELTPNEMTLHNAAKAKLELMNNDPIRRYFESILCHNSLRDNLDTLDSTVLTQHFNNVFAQMPRVMQFLVPKVIYHGNINSTTARKVDVAPEYITAIQKLSNQDNFPSLKPQKPIGQKSPDTVLKERLDKMLLLVKTSHAAMTAVSSHKATHFPLNIYGEKGSVYSAPRRGRINRVGDDGSKQEVKSNNLGIMRSFMPMPRDNALFEETSINTANQYRRPPDASTYAEGAEMPEKFFSSQVSPFVNSISGTMLCQLRVMAKLLNEQQLEYKNNPEQLKIFFKSFVSYMIYNSGGHSLQEFMSVFQLPQVQELFKDIPGFADLNLRQLFQTENDASFMESMDEAIIYCDKLSSRNLVHTELMGVNSETKEDTTYQGQARSTLLKSAIKEIIPIQERIDRALDCLQTNNDSEEKTNAAALFIIKQINATKRIQHENPKTFLEEDEASVKKFREEFLKIKENGVEPFNAAIPEKDQTHHLSIRDYLESIYEKKKTEFYQVSPQTPSFAALLDKAYAVYTDEQAHLIDKEIAQGFIIYALDLKNPSAELNIQIKAAMELRAQIRATNPHFIPGRSPLPQDLVDQNVLTTIRQTTQFKKTDNPTIKSMFENNELLDVITKAKLKDSGGRKGQNQKTIFFNPLERDTFRIDISQGRFMRLGKPISTHDSLSHGKKGFAAFTLDVHGELSVFPHVDHDKTGIAHSSMNEGRPVVCAGEIQIQDGKLKAITTYSGHYRPTLYNIYKALDYFQNRGVDISETKLYSFENPTKLNIQSKPSPYPKLYESQAQDLLQSYKASLRKNLNSIKQDMIDYQTKRDNLWHKYIYKGNLRQEKLSITQALVEYIESQERAMNKISNLNEYKHHLTQIHSTLEYMNKENINISTFHKGQTGLVDKKLTNSMQKISESKEQLSRIKNTGIDKDSSNDEKIQSMKGLGRPRS